MAMKRPCIVAATIGVRLRAVLGFDVRDQSQEGGAWREVGRGEERVDFRHHRADDFRAFLFGIGVYTS